MRINLGQLADLPCLPIDSMGPLQDGQSWCMGGAASSQLACMPAGSVGPLGPGQVWCDTGSATASVTDTLSPASTSSSTGISTTTLAIAGAVVIGAIALMGGRR